MSGNYLKIGLRRLLKNKGYLFLNVGGLATGMTVFIFIGLWVNDELSFNRYYKNYNSIAQVMCCMTDPETSAIQCGQSIQYPVGETLKNRYPDYFKHVLIYWWTGDNTLSTADKKFRRKGQFIEDGIIDMLSLKMITGSAESLSDPHSVILSKSTADAIFGSGDPKGKNLRINNLMDVQVTGVYDDIPKSNHFSDVQFFSTWDLWLSHNAWAQGKEADWDNRPFGLYVQLQPGITTEVANEAIKDLYTRNVPADFFATIERFKPDVQLVPMNTWHLYSEFKDGKPSTGRITYVWLFSITGILVLVLACINFINLSTAQSEKRAREVGVRKVAGSRKSQLIRQFISESFLIVLFAFIISVALVILLQDWFNELADKDIALPFRHPFFWVIAIIFIVITSIMAGAYPAFYLSSFQPVEVLKGVLHTGSFAVLPRKVLVVVQFTVSVVLIIGTLIIYRQVHYARTRPIGYERSNLITVDIADPAFKGKTDILKTELFSTGVVSEIASSSGPLTAIWNSTSGYDWPGKDPAFDAEFAICNINLDFGRTVGWEIKAGRDLSYDFRTDSLLAIIVNEAAVRYMGLKDPVGKEFTDVDEFGKKKWTRTIIAVVKDLIMESPYDLVRPTLFFYNPNVFMGQLHIKINPALSASAALPKIKEVFNKTVPSSLFDYKFVDEVYAGKFSQEERIGKLSGVFSVIAIFISCLGLFGLMSYVTELRTSEIGIRKIVGASVFNLWGMLAIEFVRLVMISCIFAVPVAWYFLIGWLSKYEYRTAISWWILLLSCLGAILITLLTVSYHSIRIANMDPVKSLRSE